MWLLKVRMIYFGTQINGTRTTGAITIRTSPIVLTIPVFRYPFSELGLGTEKLEQHFVVPSGVQTSLSPPFPLITLLAVCRIDDGPRQLTREFTHQTLIIQVPGSVTITRNFDDVAARS